MPYILKKPAFIALVVAAACLLGGLFLQLGKEANAFSKDLSSIRPVPAAETSTVIRGFSEKKAPTLVFIYASWCPVCKRNFPVLTQVAEKYKAKGLNVVALSVDREKDDLENYLAKQEPLPFIPYYVMQRFPGELQDGLLKAGIRYNGSIPYVALLDEKGNVLGQGNYSVASVDKVLHTLLP